MTFSQNTEMDIQFIWYIGHDFKIKFSIKTKIFKNEK